MSTRRRVEFELVGNAGNIEAVLNRLNSGITRTGRGAQGLNRELSAVDRQLMAIRTTARYALAGGLVFGITGAISRLRDFQDRLAQVAALSGSVSARGGYQGPSGNFLNRVGDQAILLSNQLGIATSDVQDYMSRFFSAFDVQKMGGNEKLQQMRNFVSEVGALQASLGAEAGDPQQLAGGIAGLVRQIDPNGRNIGRNTSRVSGLIWQMLASTPNITGRDVSRDVGRVGATMSIANMTPEQVFAVWSQAGTAGGSASVIGRGVAQLLGTSLLHPQTPEQIQAFSRAGLPTDPTTLRNMGGINVLMRMMQAVAPNGASIGNRQILGNEDVEDADALAGAGVKGVNLTLLYNLLGRQESVRQFINLLGAGGTKALRERIEAERDATKEAHQRERAAQRERILSRTAQAAANIPLQFARQMRWPLEHLAAPPLIAASNFAGRHSRVTQATEAALGGALAVYSGRRLLKSLRGARGGGAGAIAGAAIGAEELSAVVGGGQTDGTRANPFWVIISPVSWAVGSPGGMGGPGLSQKVPGNPASRLGGWAKRLAPFGAFAAGRGGALALGAGAGATAGIVLATSGDQAVGSHPGDFTLRRGQTLAGAGRGELANPLMAALQFAHMKANQLDKISFSGQANADLTIRLVDAQGRTITVQEHKGVPIKMIPDKGVPTTGGKPGSKKGSH